MEIRDKENQFHSNPLIINDSNLTIFVGVNNSGKSTILRSICSGHEDHFLVSTDRLFINQERTLSKDSLSQNQQYFRQIKDADSDNIQKNIDILQELWNLNNNERKEIYKYYNEYFPDSIKEELENPQNKHSTPLLKMKGFPMSKQGSGARAILQILIKLFDKDINVICIDEPELGLEPKLQKFLFKSLKTKSQEKRIIIATHSHLFLDREQIENNYVCKRNRKGKIIINKIENEVEIRNKTFELLGNELKDFGLPERIIIVEGVSDKIFIDKVIALANKNYNLFFAECDNKIASATEAISQFLRFSEDLAPVYLKNIWIIGDFKQQRDIHLREWKRKLNDSHVKILSKNGIEHYYPKRIFKTIFQTDDINRILPNKKIKDPIKYKNISISKKELAEKVAVELAVDDLKDINNEVFDYIENTLP